MAKDFRIIIENPERTAEFMDIFGRKEVCILTPIPDWTRLGESEEPVQVYWLDLDEITPEEKHRLVQHIAAKFNAEPGAVEAALNTLGLPIRASDCFVVINNPHRWF